MEIVLPDGGAISCINAIKRNKEIGKRKGELIEIGDPFRDGRSAVKPTVDRPRPGIGHVGRALGKRNGDWQRQIRHKLGQLAVLLFYLGNIGGSARQTNGHMFTQTEGPVVPAARLDRPDRQICPFGKLRGDEPANERGING